MVDTCGSNTSPVVSGLVAAGSLALPMGVLYRELSLVHRDNAVTTMFNAIVSISVVVVVFFFVGYALSNGFIEGRGQQDFIGERFFFLITRDPCAFSDVLTELARVLTVVLIVLGGVAERIHTYAAAILAFLISAFIFAVPRYWTAGDNSWLLKGSRHLQDVSGNASMFFMASVIALVVIRFTGIRYASAGSTRTMNQPTGLLTSTFLHALGGVFLLGFASLKRADQTGDAIAVLENPQPRSLLAAVNLVIAMALGCLSALGLHEWFASRWSHLPPMFHIRVATGGAIGAMVAISGFAGATVPEVVIPVAVIAGLVVRTLMLLTIRWQLDDATDASAMYLGGSVVGLLAAPFWDEQDGIFYHVGEWSSLGWNIVAILCLGAWCAVFTSAVCWLLVKLQTIAFAKAHLQDPRGLDMSIFTAHRAYRSGQGNTTQMTSTTFTENDMSKTRFQSPETSRTAASPIPQLNSSSFPASPQVHQIASPYFPSSIASPVLPGQFSDDIEL
eukprot:m.22197 g.22197  ORF g.22197 m.22197 type:complete len:503 (-) comp9267_c0_seq2:58-1566(-)